MRGRPAPVVPTVRAFVGALLAAAVAGCRDAPVDALAPPAIVYGEDTCDACGMIIDDPRFAAATIGTREGRTTALRFDDIGDMLSHHAAHPELVVDRWYVHDFVSSAWLDAEQAVFVRAAPSALISPMGHGLAAFTDRVAAGAFAAEVDGELIDFVALGAAFGIAPAPIDGPPAHSTAGPTGPSDDA